MLRWQTLLAISHCYSCQLWLMAQLLLCNINRDPGPFWFGVQSAGGGTAVTQMLTAISPSYALSHNSLPVSAGITSRGLKSYFIYHVLPSPFLFIRPKKLNWIFMSKTILVLPMALGMVFCLAMAAKNELKFWDKSNVIESNRARLWLSYYDIYHPGVLNHGSKCF